VVAVVMAELQQKGFTAQCASQIAIMIATSSLLY